MTDVIQFDAALTNTPGLFKALLNCLPAGPLQHVEFACTYRACLLLFAGRDLIGRARTGSGKTLAFALPVIEKLMKRDKRPRSPGCIVLAPTRELAKQVEREFAATGPLLKTACVYGGELQPVACNDANCVGREHLFSLLPADPSPWQLAWPHTG